ncbi:MAG: mannose-1-phosphate guanylyltransferase/mannose-6-phosphate isomerase [Treponema sp.]|nr:mannose-1-phosphate guanylyltransferase/mannose-6-phosphate isomerase [Treponema sp.]
MLPVILSGGAGSRLWPLSTPAVPKQFLPLMDAKQTMIQQTIMRLDGLDFMSPPLVICNAQHLPLVQSQLSEIDKLQRPVMLEPASKNTAPAIAAAALYCKAHEDDGLMLVLPSDHTILNIDAFQSAVAAARNAAAKNTYALFGIVPARAETGYGYIETEACTDNNAKIVKAFKEKPDEATAKKYVAAGNYYWNSGMFAIPAELFLHEMELFNADTIALVKESYEHAEHSDAAITLSKTSFEKINGNSIDYAIMEKTKNAVVVPLDAGWSDVGSWNMVWELSHKDASGNAANNPAFFKDASGNLIYAEDKRPVALLGIKDCVVIESKDGLLIADMHYVQEVKTAAERLTKSR